MTDRVVPQYMPSLDGLRALACAAVVAFHLSIPYTEMGWAGLFLFFVLSGFLITGILLDTKGREGYFRSFYIRRAFRILPVYYLLLAAAVITTAAFSKPISDLPWYLLYGQNMIIAAKHWLPAFPEWMTHAWTLAVEEQFYILWPLCVFCLSRRALTVTCIAVIALANVSRIFFSLATHNAYLVEATLPCVMDSLALGAFIAILARSGKTPEGLARTGRTAAATFGILTLALVLCHGYRTYGSPNTYLLGSLSNLCLYTLLSACFAGVILTGVFGAGPTSRLLSLPFLRHIGRMSYGIYLYHLPVLFWTPIVLRRCGFSVTGSPERRFWVKAAAALLTYLVALASWNLIEKPCLRLKERFAPREGKTRDARVEEPAGLPAGRVAGGSPGNSGE